MRRTLGIKRLHALSKHENYGVVPPWLIVMYNTMFFSTCMLHRNTKKNELDRFCIDCLSSLCSHCLHSHTRHHHVKIRRYVYSDVINRHDLCKLFNCSGIQSYHTNKTKVLFLKQRNHHHQQVNSKEYYSCIICDRNLQENSLYCSIACKVISIFGDRRHCREKINHEHNTTYNQLVNSIEEYPFTPPSSEKRYQKRSRKGFPLRAPLF